MISAKKDVYDVAVVGAGPAGSTTAILLAKAGAKVILLDKAKFPRSKPCGGGITGRAWSATPIDLTPVVENTIYRVRFSFSMGRSFESQYPRPLVYLTQRDRLDSYLANAAVTAGAVFRDDSSVIRVQEKSEHVELETSSSTISARFLIGADGANGRVARSVGLYPVLNAPVAVEALFPYRENDEGKKEIPTQWQDTIALELGSIAGGYGWAFPKDDHLNVGCGGWRWEAQRMREHTSTLAKHFGATQAQSLQGHSLPIRQGLKRITTKRTLLVGDSAGLLDPISAEGIFGAFSSGRLAAEAVILMDSKNAPSKLYEDRVNADLMPDILAATLLRDAYHFTPRLFYEILKRRTDLWQRLCMLVTGEKTYVQFMHEAGLYAVMVRLWAQLGRTSTSRASRQSR